MPSYTSYYLNARAGSNIGWFDTIRSPYPSDVIINLFGTLARIINTDGTWTVLHGDIGGFSFSATGHLQGTIRWITHTTASSSGFIGAAEYAAVGDVFNHLNIDAETFLYSTPGNRYNLVFDRPGMVINGDAGDNLLGGGRFADVFNGFGGNDTVSYRMATVAVTADLTGFLSGSGPAAGDVFNSIENLTGSDLAFGDLLAGDDGANTLAGLGGGDRLAGRGGDDVLLGGDGNDTLIGGLGADMLDGGAGIDELSYEDATSGVSITLHSSGSGTMVATGGRGTDTYANIENLRGSRFADALTGNAGDNDLSGGDGNDQLRGLRGNDTLRGGNGDDWLYGDEGDDLIQGDAGTDTLDFSVGFIPFVSLFMNELGHGSVALGLWGTDTFFDIENVIGTSASDTISGSRAANLLVGGSGNDVLHGYGGNDRLEGGDGDDMLGGDADWNLEGAAAHSGDDTLLGQRGRDLLTGSLGNDTINGGMGVDTISYESLFDETGYGDYYIEADLANGVVRKYYRNIYDEAYLIGTDTIVTAGFDDYESFFGTAANDTLTDNSFTTTMFGGAGHDTYRPVADNKADWVTDTVGFDTLDFALATSAVLVGIGAPGFGTASGGGIGTLTFTGIEQFVLTRFDDVMTTGVGTLGGSETVFGMDGNDVIGGGNGADILAGGRGIDTLDYSQSHAGIVISLISGQGEGGTAEGDRVSGFENVIGSAHSDRITGSALRNDLTGGEGRDVLRGGNGADRFIYGAITESTPLATGRDLIVDFDTAGGDVIDLSAIDANADGGTANDSFTFRGTDAFTGLGQIRYAHVNGNTFVEINTSGSTGADMVILLQGIHTLLADDFRL